MAAGLREAEKAVCGGGGEDERRGRGTLQATGVPPPKSTYKQHTSAQCTHIATANAEAAAAVAPLPCLLRLS